MLVKADRNAYINTDFITEVRVGSRDPNNNKVIKLYISLSNKTDKVILDDNYANNFWTVLQADPTFTNLDLLKDFDVI